MSGSSRMPPPGRKPASHTSSSMRPPPPPRPLHSRANSAAPVMTGRASPAESLSSSRGSKHNSPVRTATGTKRKEREFESEYASQETNINVVVRCRGRSDREVRENSGVVVSTDGVKGNTVDLSMGSSAISNKTYTFDRVFSPAADQFMVFDEVVVPILDEVVSGFNCTIFAYGQTGTGKTYTMSGDITDVLPLPDDSGIIPRVLHALFKKLENVTTESSVKCSFIELYNEELRDLLAADEAVKLKIFDDSSRKSHGATMVQGMEETHIASASKGIALLREGSLKRQVAATKCNDLSSRSHTVFTITTYIKRTAENGEDYVSSAKLNLVDLAGSENIQRSGAENKRAAEAGLINKSLLTLGRVINALVDKSTHIPYRESKLTRLLQDSLGGRTKTCIIATLSPAKSNLEETISTLDYAFRAKNIRNKPQVNQLVSKKTLLREFTAEIEKLKSELIATRQRNGVYLTTENYEELTTESESRRILSEEQRDKIDTMEANLRNKAQDLFALTSSFMGLKKDNETTKLELDNAQGALEKTEVALNHTRQSLAEEAMLRQAHEESEDKLANIGQDLITTLGRTTADINSLQAKHRRRSALQSANRTNWTASQGLVADTTQLLEQRMADFEARHQSMISVLSEQMETFVRQEIDRLEESKTFLGEKSAAFDKSQTEVNDQTAKSRDNMNDVLGGIQSLRQELKSKVGEGLDNLSAAAQRISNGVATELENFRTELHQSFSSLGKDLKFTFDDLLKQLGSQQEEADRLRAQLAEAGQALSRANEAASSRLETVMEEERAQGASDRADLIAQMTLLVQQHGQQQEQRLETKIAHVKSDLQSAESQYTNHQSTHDIAMDTWLTNAKATQDSLLQSRENIKNRIKNDWSAASTQSTSISNTTHSIHDETVRHINGQMAAMDNQLSALDDIVSRIRQQNSAHHEQHVASLSTLSSHVKQSYSSIGEHLTSSHERVRTFSGEMMDHTSALGAAVDPLKDEVCAPLADLRSDILSSTLTEYAPTGATPQKTSYTYIKSLPRTERHDLLLAAFRGEPLPISTSPSKRAPIVDLADVDSPGPGAMSPSKTQIFNDSDAKTQSSPVLTRPQLARPVSASSLTGEKGLREIDANAGVGAKDESHTITLPIKKDGAPSKRAHAGEGEFSKSVGSGGRARRGVRGDVAEGRENVIPLMQSVGSGGRALRSRGS